MPPTLTVTIGRAARGETACSACATTPLPVPFSPVISTLASDGPTRAIISSTGRIARDSAISVGRLSSPRSGWFSASSRWPLRKRAAQLGLRAQRGQQPLVLPRLLHEVARAARASLRPRGRPSPTRSCTTTGSELVIRVQPLQQVEPFFAAGRVARVVEVDQDHVEVLEPRGRARQLRGEATVSMLKPSLLQQQAQRFEDVGLIVGERGSRGDQFSSTIHPSLQVDRPACRTTRSPPSA